MSSPKNQLIEAEAKALILFQKIAETGIIQAGKTEKQINAEIFELASQLLGIEKYWHKRIVRAGKNTLRPYDDNPPNLLVQEDDIVFLDFGPIFEEWEADLGRTYVLGNDPHKIRLKNDVEHAWYELQAWFMQQSRLTGAELYNRVQHIAQQYGWTLGGEIAGHIIGHFPHEKLDPQKYGLYVHPDNHDDMFALDTKGNSRHWILEIHLIDEEKEIGGFFEQLLC